MQAETRPLAIYVSAQSHSSIDKAALLAGFGRENLRLVPCGENHAMCADALDTLIQQDLGMLPCAVVATTGSAAVTDIDPVTDIAAVARRHGIWLHVDAAMAGSAMHTV